MQKEAVLYERLPNHKVRCLACARYCEIGEGQIGLCGIRGNKDGKLVLYVHGKVAAAHIDPIEKKPVTHYMPGTSVFSIGTTGCNWLCKYCINFDLSQRRKVEGVDHTPEELVNMALNYGCKGIAYTYNEPSIFIEFARDCGVLARKAGLFNIFVSNGYSTPQAIGMMKEFLDCITIDFKGNGEQNFVRKYIGIPNSQPVFDTVMQLQSQTNIHVEITDLVVPGVGDDLEHAKKLCKFIYDTCGPEMPIHFLQFHPSYKMMEFEPTPIKTLENHYDVAKKEGLKYVYVGNVPGHKYEHTYCSECNKIVVRRYNFEILKWDLDDDNKCKFCGNKIPIVGKLDRNYKERKFEFVL
ncbi:MAG TPA: AmmeMemoRadiSam system radical SAM enzyme [Candidatus Nitrosotenuis sp.]|nr:AmmeMemoRadiSam system radical SAM enzyme [Candidatus Nitrosotenuis sp.]